MTNFPAAELITGRAQVHPHREHAVTAHGGGGQQLQHLGGVWKKQKKI
jgi:hypothetical protein